MKSSAVRKDESSYSPGESEEPVVSDQLEVRVARIESDVEHRIDVTNERIDNLRDSLTAKIEAGYKRTDDLRSELVKRIDDVHKELTEKYDSLKDLIHSSRVWALLLYITLAGGLLTLIARAFKWI